GGYLLGVQDAVQHFCQEGTAGTGAGFGTDLFVVESSQHGDLVGLGLQQCPQPRVDRDQVVQPWCGKKFVVDPDRRGFLGVGEDEVESFNGLRIDTGVAGDGSEKICVVTHPDDGHEVLLLIKFQAVVDAAIQVN